MAENDKVDFGELAKEALAGSYNPRARKCWFWSHAWTMWETEPARRYEFRRCVNCGRSQQKKLAGVCTHLWVTQTKHNIVGRDREAAQGLAYIQQCSRCGDVRRKDLV